MKRLIYITAGAALLALPVAAQTVSVPAPADTSTSGSSKILIPAEEGRGCSGGYESHAATS